MKTKIIFIFIILLATFLRLYKLGEVPPSLISDEASIGYNAYSILKTGRDEWGNFLPLSFPAFGDYKLPGLIYATVPSVAIFGLTEFSTRLPSAIFGIGTVIVVYFLALELMKGKKTALLASFFTAISPWSLQISRMAIEANMAVFFTILGSLLFLKSFKKPKLIFLSFLSFASTIYTYNTNRVFVPLLVLSLLFLYKKELIKFKKFLTMALFMVFVITLPISKYIIQQSVTGRLSKVSITQDQGTIYQINEEREFCTRSLPKVICYIASNKPIKFSETIIKNYLSHFSARFLFLTGPENLKHYQLPGFGEYYLFQFPFLILGLFVLIKQKSKSLFLIIPWLLIYPLASSLTSTAHPIRAAVGIPMFEIIIAYGIVAAISSLRNKPKKFISIIALIILALININEYFFLYYKKYSVENSEAFQYGYKEAMKIVNQEESKYSKILVTKEYGEPQIFYLFYNKIDPKWYQESSDVTRIERPDKWKEVSKIGNVYFKDLTENDLKPKSDTLFVLGANELKGGLTAATTLFYLDGKVAFHIAR